MAGKFRFDSFWKGFRDVVLFFAGLSGVFYETIAATHIEPSLLIMFGAMMGLPMFLRKDES